MSKDRDGEIELLARGVFVREGKVLVCHNRKKRNCFLPGGHIDCGESAKRALKREIREELGLPCKVGRFLGAVEHTFKYHGKRTYEINLVFEMDLGKVCPPDRPRSMEKKLEFLWVGLAGLRRAGFEPSVFAALLPKWVKAMAGDEKWGSSIS